MKKIVVLGVAIISAIVTTTSSAADGAKHFGYGHGNGYYRPAYVAQGPVRPYYAPGYRYGGGGYGGYWHGGRWIAPVAIAAAIGGIAIAGSSYYYNLPTYVAPSYYAPAAVSYGVNYAAPVADGFSYADVNGDGYVSYEEAAVYPHWQRNFGRMDRNRDGYLTRDEVAGWRYR